MQLHVTVGIFNITYAVFGLSSTLVHLGCLDVNFLRPYCLLKMCPKRLVTIMQKQKSVVETFKTSSPCSTFFNCVIECEAVHICISETVNLSRSGMVRLYEIVQNYHLKTRRISFGFSTQVL